MINALRMPHVPATTAARATIWAVGLFAITQGLGILLGGAERWTSPGYAIVRQVPGGGVTWGTAALALGVLILVGSFTRRWIIKAAGLVGLSIWTAGFGLSIVFAAMINPLVGTTAGPINILVAVVAAILITIDESPTGG